MSAVRTTTPLRMSERPLKVPLYPSVIDPARKEYRWPPTSKLSGMFFTLSYRQDSRNVHAASSLPLSA